jgi:hypothetical protein
MTLSPGEFIRRFLIHSLPPGFQRIRHCGFLSNRFRKEKLSLCRRLLATPFTELLPSPSILLPAAITSSLRQQRCPQCGIGVMSRTLILPAFRWPLLPPDRS